MNKLNFSTVLLLLSVGTFSDVQSKLPSIVQRDAPEAAERALTQARADLQTLRVIVARALETNAWPAKDVDATLARLQRDVERVRVLETLDAATRASLKTEAHIILDTYQALLEEAALLDLWTRGYAGYEKDLNDNFKGLPNAAVKKPDNKKLYEEIGLTAESGKKASFNLVRSKYQQKYDSLKSKQNFDGLYFRPYLRVLDYVFRTPYGKLQYDVYVAGKKEFNKKADALKKYQAHIQKLFTQDLPQLRELTGTVQAEVLG